MRISVLGLIVAILFGFQIIALPNGSLDLIIYMLNQGYTTTGIIRLAIGLSILFIFIPLITAWIFTRLILLIQAQRKNQAINLKDNNRTALRRFLSLFWVMILKILAIISPIILLIVPVMV
ncbi:hypothetical protein D6827_00950, partial [Candidatus Parcubacteria bacterium]